MIPKIIHYCWFGGNEEPSDVKKCIESWKKYCPDYVIKRWDETNYCYQQNFYTAEAYLEKKWAFVSDYARLDIIYQNGGIYLDTDVELVKSLDDIIAKNNFFFALEKDTNIQSGISTINVATGLGFGAEKGNEVLKSMIEQYYNIHFKTINGLDLTPCPVRNTSALKKYGLILKDQIQYFEGGTIYPSEYFCPIECSSDVVNFTDNTVSIHHYSASWKNSNEKMLYRIRIIKRKIVKKINMFYMHLKE